MDQQTTQSQPNETTVDPGRGFGIAGFVLAFVGVQLVGLILSIIGFHKSAKAGFKNTLALVGIILNSVFIVFTIGILVAITVVAYNGITARANLNEAKSNAEIVQKTAEIINSDKGVYPTSTEDFRTSSIPLTSSINLISDPTELSYDNGVSTIAYVTDDMNKDGTIDGGIIYYWDYANNTVSSDVKYVGDAMSDADMTDANPAHVHSMDHAH